MVQLRRQVSEAVKDVNTFHKACKIVLLLTQLKTN